MGGNAIAGVSRINQANSFDTVQIIFDQILAPIGLDESQFAMLGSICKKEPYDTSGDIDLGVQSDFPEQMMTLIFNQLQKLGYSARIMKNMGVVFAAFPINNMDGRQPNEFVQVDFMIVQDLKFAKWSYYAPAFGESKYKGLYRNIMNFAVAKYSNILVLQNDESGTPTLWSRYFINMNTGLFMGTQTNLSEKTGKITSTTRYVERRFVTSSPSEIVKLIYGVEYDVDDVSTFEKTMLIMEQKPIELRKKVYESVMNTLLKKKYPIPIELTEAIKNAN